MILEVDFFMKKYFLILLVLFSAVCGLYADSDYDPFDKLAEKLLDDFEDEDSTIVVKVFNSDLSNNERKRISKSVQFALYCTNEIEIVDDIEDADYVCTGNIETDGPKEPLINRFFSVFYLKMFFLRIYNQRWFYNLMHDCVKPLKKVQF